MIVGELCRFSTQLPADAKYDFITLTNAVHEISPLELPGIVFDCIDRLSESGCLFIYDTDRIVPFELGAVIWTAREVECILVAFLKTLGCSEYRPEVGEWKHQSCNGWNTQIHRSHLALPCEIRDRREDVVTAIIAQIRCLLQHKLHETKSALDKLAQFGPQTAEEETDRIFLLHNMYALMNALGIPQ
jgi:hypothetical protein